MSVPILRELRLTAFKSFRNAVLPIDAVTVLTGRNSSGKSNALDGLEVLARLASGMDLSEALDARGRKGGPIRGGSRGCPPHGEREFALGCTVTVDDAEYRLDIRVETEPRLRIVEERLSGSELGTFPLTTRDDAAESGPSESRLVTPAIARRHMRTDSSALPGFDAPRPITRALAGVFHLDPVPHLMREYVSAKDTELRRTGENVSAVLARLAAEDPTSFERLTRLVQQIADDRICGIQVQSSSLGDVILALEEQLPNRDRELTSAREMSDGLLRFIAIATALLTPNRELDVGISKSNNSVLLVIEELENGLHPSQAGRVLELIREVSTGMDKQILVTTHSPALLNATTGELNRSVIVCYRDPDTGYSKLSRLTDLPGYAEAMASGPVGDAVTRGRLTQPEAPDRDYREFNRLLGLDHSA